MADFGVVSSSIKVIAAAALITTTGCGAEETLATSFGFIEVVPFEVRWDHVPLDSTPSTQRATILNKGTRAFTISSVTVEGDADVFTIPEITNPVPPNAEQEVLIEFNPARAGLYRATVTFNSDAQNNPAKTVTLIARAVQAPEPPEPPDTTDPCRTIIRDRNFDALNWRAIVVSSQGDAKHEERQETKGGRPGNFRIMTHELMSANATLRIVHLYQFLRYDPATSGPIEYMTFTEDRKKVSDSGREVGASPVLMQAGERFTADYNIFRNTEWTSYSSGQLRVEDFRSEANRRPDFSADGAPIGLGFERRNTVAEEVSLSHGIDNWQVVIRKADCM